MNLFIVATPHQLMNAIEAREHFVASRNVLIIALSKPYPLASFHEMLREHAWDGLHHVESLHATTITAGDSPLLALKKRAYACFEDYRRRRHMDSVIRQCGLVGKLFLGNYNVNYMRHIANRAGCERVYLLDDGTATLSISKQRNLARHDDRLDFTNTHRRVWRERLAGLITCPIQSVTFFTTYELEVGEDDHVVRNDYSFLRGLASSHAPADEVFFLGQPMVEEGIMTRDKFFVYLKGVRQYFGGQRVIYLPHKRENSEKVEMLEREFGFGVKRFDVPIEYQMSVRGTRPRVLASFFSSALENSRVIFGSLMRIKSFRMDPADFPTRRDYVSLIYSYYESKQNDCFEVID